MRSVPELLDIIESALAELAERLAEPETATADTGSDEPAAPFDLHDTVIRLQRASSTLAVVSARALTRWDHERVWAGNGHRSAAHRLARDAHRNIRKARHDLWRAHQLDAMPHAATSILTGRLSIDHIDLLGRANQPWRDAVFNEHEQSLVDHCTQLDWEPATRIIDYWIQHADALAAEHAGQIRTHDTHCWASTTLHGTVIIDATLDPIGGSIVTTELERLERLERKLWHHDQTNGTNRTPRQRRAAALIEMATRSASTPEGAQRPRPLFTILVGDDTTRHLCELATTRTVLHPTELLPHLSTALVESVIFDGPHQVLGVSHKRTFTGALRRAIQVRDRNCQHPTGCTTPTHHCDIDHITPWAHGGTTDQHNGRLLWPAHNRHPDLRDHPEQQPGRRPPPPDDHPGNHSRHTQRRHLGITRARLRWRELQAAHH